MAKRRKSTKRSSKSAKSRTLIEAAERAVLRQSNKILVAATKRYKRFVRQASKATNDANKKKYLAAALTAVVIAGVVAKELKARIDKQPQVATVRKKRI
jgi:non-homologous end joining protein Ku